MFKTSSLNFWMILLWVFGNSLDPCSYFYEKQIVKVKESSTSSIVQFFDLQNFTYYYSNCGPINRESLPFDANMSYDTQLYKCVPNNFTCIPFYHSTFPEILSLAEKSISFQGHFDNESEDTVQIISQYSIDIYTDVSPPMPVPGPTPTPSYDPHPNSIIFTQNSTHYVAFDISKFNNSTFSGSKPFTVDQRKGLLYYQFSPWELQSCPNGYKCSGSTESNMYACWIDINEGKFCHQIGDKRIFLSTSELDTGYRLHYGGAYNIQTELRIKCDPSLPTEPLFSFSETFSSYNRAMTGPQFSFNVSSSAACPIAFEYPPMYTPIPIPTNTPNPFYKPQTKLIDKNEFGEINFDLKNLNISSPIISLRHNNTYQRPMMYISPFEVTKCPNGYQSPNMDLGNIWKCTANNTDTQKDKQSCFTVGDMRYGLELKLIENETIKVTYKGGINNYSVSIIYLCDRSDRDYSFFYNDNYADIGIEEDDSPFIQFIGRTQEACRVQTPPDEFSAGGEISCLILTILYMLFTTYFFGGVLFYYFKNKTGQFPNTTFWIRFFENVKIGASSCFKKKNQSNSQIQQRYDTLN